MAIKSTAKKFKRFPLRLRDTKRSSRVYAKLPGWQSSTFGMDSYDQLPAKAKQYLEFIEKESGAKVGIVSTGPDRDQTMFIPEFSKVLNGVSEKSK